jgi:hypothetical protein
MTCCCVFLRHCTLALPRRAFFQVNREGFMCSSGTILLTKASTAPKCFEPEWSKLMLAFLASHLEPNATTGAIYAELEHPAEPIRFFVSAQRERMLTKEQRAYLAAECDFYHFRTLLIYLIRDVLRQQIWSMGCGILRIRFEDEAADRLFTVYARLSSRIGCFFQLDRFSAHL